MFNIINDPTNRKMHTAAAEYNYTDGPFDVKPRTLTESIFLRNTISG